MPVTWQLLCQRVISGVCADLAILDKTVLILDNFHLHQYVLVLIIYMIEFSKDGHNNHMAAASALSYLWICQGCHSLGASQYVLT